MLIIDKYNFKQSMQLYYSIPNYEKYPVYLAEKGL